MRKHCFKQLQLNRGFFLEKYYPIEDANDKFFINVKILGRQVSILVV